MDVLTLYREKLAEIDQALKSNEITPDHANYSRQQLTDELQEYLAEFSQAEEEAQFSAGNTLGATLLEYGEQQGYTDPEQFVMDLSGALELSPEETYDLITTDQEFDDEVVASVFDLLEGEEEYEEDIEDEYDSEEEENDAEYDFDDEEEEEDEEDEEEASYSARVEALEDEIAEFQVQGAVKNAYFSLQSQARDMVNSGDLPPAAYNLVFAEFDRDEDMLASFSQVLEKQGSNVEQELYAMQRILDVFNELGYGDIGLFSQVVDDEVNAEFSEEDAMSDLEAELYVKRLRNKA